MRSIRLDVCGNSTKPKIDDKKTGVGSEESCEEPTEELPEESEFEESEEELDEEGSEVSEELEEELTEEVSEQSAFQASSDDEQEFSKERNGNPKKKLFEESGTVNSNEKKRSFDGASAELGPSEDYPLPKKCKQEQSLWSNLDVESVVRRFSNECRTPRNASCDDGDVSEQQEGTGSSGKRRRSRWDAQTKEDEDGNEEGQRTNKRRKTKWSDEDSQLKMLGPIKLPDFAKEFISVMADPEVRELNMKLSVINSKLMIPDLHDDRPEEERTPSPPPVYDYLGFRTNSRDARYKEKLILERQNIISSLISKNPAFKSPPEYKPSKFSKKLYIPTREYPGYNFVGLILGPRGNTQKKMEKESKAKIVLRGKGSVKEKVGHKKSDHSDNDDLHVLIEADNQKSLDKAVGMVEKLLIPVKEDSNDHKRSQLKELAKLKSTLIDDNVCKICGEAGHKNYACPNQKSTFNSSCNRCGGNHLSFTCSFTTPPTLCSNICKTRLGASPYCSYSGSGFGSAPSTTDSKICKEVDDTNLFVGFLPPTVDEDRLKGLFSSFGKLVEAKVVKDRSTGLSKGYGFVRYDNTGSAAAAVKMMNGYRIDGKILVVKVAGNQLAAGSSPNIAAIPNYPKTISRGGSVERAWPGPPGSLLSEPRTPFYECDSLGFPHVSIFPGHSESIASKQPSSNDSSSPQIQFLSPSSLAGFPGHPEYRSSFSYPTYLSTPTSYHSPLVYRTQTFSRRLTPYSYTSSSESYRI